MLVHRQRAGYRRLPLLHDGKATALGAQLLELRVFGGGAGFNQGAGLGLDPSAGLGLGAGLSFAPQASGQLGVGMVASLLNLSTQLGELGRGRGGLRLGRLFGEATKAAALLLSSLGLGAQTNEFSLSLGVLGVSGFLDVAAKAATLLMAGLGLGAYPHQLGLGLALYLDSLGFNASSAGQRIHRVEDDDHAIVAVGLLEAVGIEDARRLWRFFDEELMFESEGRVANRDDVVVAERLDDPLGDGYTVDLGAVRAFVDNRIVWAFGIQLGMVAG